MKNMYLLSVAPLLFNSFFLDHEKGWHWYERDAQPNDYDRYDAGPMDLFHEDDVISEDKKVNNPLEKLKKYQQKLEEVKAEAVLNPTSQNVARYQKLQYEAMEKAQLFSDIWMKNLYLHPELDYSNKVPTFQKARHAYLLQEQERKEDKIRKLSKSYGLFYFFKGECMYCRIFAPIVKEFTQKYKWEVLAISESGDVSQEFANSTQDNGLADEWGVVRYPSLFAVNPKTGHVIPISNGMISIDEMEDRIVSISEDADDV